MNFSRPWPSSTGGATRCGSPEPMNRAPQGRSSGLSTPKRGCCAAATRPTGFFFCAARDEETVATWPHRENLPVRPTGCGGSKPHRSVGGTPRSEYRLGAGVCRVAVARRTLATDPQIHRQQAAGSRQISKTDYVYCGTAGFQLTLLNDQRTNYRAH